MRAELIMVGTELLLGEVVDTNAAWLAGKMASIGVGVYNKVTVGDNWTRIAAALSQALARADVVVISGGLGPTQDDLTRQVIAAVTGHPLERLPAAEEHVRDFFQHSSRPIPESVWGQALFPQGSLPLANERGTALGILLELPDEKAIIALPGVPVELKGMFSDQVVPYLQGRLGASLIHSRTLRFFGLGESSLEELVRDLIEEQLNPTLAPYTGSGEARLRISAKASSISAAEALIAPVEAEISRRAASYLYGHDDDSLEKVVGDLMAKGGYTLSTAESCTGGLIAHRITNIPGSSGYFLRGWITYSNEAKFQELGVPTQLLATYGAVSAPVAKAMASGARANSGSTYALAVTGIAGPGGGSRAKPVGLVYIGMAGPEGQAKAEEFRFRGQREEIKHRTASAALNMLRQQLQ